MTSSVNIREIVLEILMEITEEEAYSHVVIRSVLEKYQYLEKRDRAFISRVSEGTLEYLLQMDYIIECFFQSSRLQYETPDPQSFADVCLPAEIHGQRAGFRGLQ